MKLNLYGISTLVKILTPSSVNLSSRLFKITEILSASEESRVLCLTSNFASTRGIHHRFVVNNQCMNSTRAIRNQFIDDLEDSSLIRDYEEAWGSLLLLGAKPHQESCDDIDFSIWRLCVSYRVLNSITLPFQFSIPRCADSIENLGDSCGPVYTISLDARSGYHQIGVRKSDQEKLAFFTPSGEKKTYNVLPLDGPARNGILTK